jgi:hypothetical protein
MSKSSPRKPKRAVSRAVRLPATKENGPATQAAEEQQVGTPTHKLAIVITLLRRPEGASIEELVKATGWQAHSVRALISRAVKKKQVLAVTSEKSGGTRVYRVAG